MNPERWREVRAVFDELVELEPHRQSERLAALEGTDPELCRAVHSLLRADAEADSRLAGMSQAFSPPSPDVAAGGPVADALGLVGRTLSHFRILEPLGAGGMGVVYTAEDTRLGRLVALKFPLPAHRLDDSAKARFLQEARSAGALDHPNLCSVYEVGESEDGLLFLAMALYPGETLKGRLTREGALPVAQALAIARQVVQGLAAANEAGIVHRDLKPANVMLLPSGGVKILDFGLAKVRDLSLTGSGTLLGTAAYMSPEQIRGGPVDGRADLWALGVVLYEMLTGRQPFQGENEVSIAHAIVHEAPARPSTHRPGIPAAVENLIIALLDKDPAGRPANAAMVDGELAAIERGRPQPPRIRLYRGPASAALVATAVLLAVAAGLGVGRAFHSPVNPPADADLVAVAPFQVLDRSLTLWREGLADMLTRDLDGAGPLRTVGGVVAFRDWPGDANRTAADALGNRTGAGVVVYGSVVRLSPDTIALRASVLDRAASRTTDLELRGPEQRMGELADSLVVRILISLGRSRPIASARRVSLGARSLPALREFLRGEQFYRRGAWDSALAHYDQAVAEEADFALALRRMAQVVAWGTATAHGYHTWGDYIRRAAALNHGLAPRDSLLLLSDSLKAAATAPAPADGDALVHDNYRAVEVLEEAARRYPFDPDIWHELGEVRYHAPPPLRIPEQVLEAFERAIALDPGFGPAYEHVVELALQLRGPVQAAHYARTGAALASANERSALRLAAWVLDSGVERPSVRRALSTASGNTLWFLGRLHLNWATDSSEAAVNVLHELWTGRHDEAGAGRLITDSVLRARNLSWALAFRGHLGAAADLAAAPHPDPRAAAAAATVDPFLELALFSAIPESLARQAFERVLLPDAQWGGSPYPAPPRHLLGAPWWLARGDTAALHRFALRAARARAAGAPVATMRGRYLQAAATGYLALARRDSVQAIRLLQAIPDTLCIVVPCFHEKLTLSRLLASSGAEREAATVLDRWGASAGNTPSAVLAALERGRLAERLSDAATARNRYRFVAQAWRAADSTLQPFVAEARDGLIRLSPVEPGE